MRECEWSGRQRGRPVRAVRIRLPKLSSRIMGVRALLTVHPKVERTSTQSSDLRRSPRHVHQHVLRGHCARGTRFPSGGAVMIRAGTSLRGLRMISSPPRRRRTSNADTVLNQADWFTAEKDKYLTIAEDHAKLGYGRSNFPIVAGMTSIDNYYLLLSLWHGFIASGLLIILLFGTSIRLFRRGLRETDLGFPVHPWRSLWQGFWLPLFLL